MRYKVYAKFNIGKPLIVFAIVILFFSFQSRKVNAAIKNTINYQTKITLKTNGLNAATNNTPCIVSGSTDTCDFRIRIWNVSTGGTATSGNNLLFEELFTDQEIGDTSATLNLAINSVCGATASGTHAWGTTGASASVCNLFDDNGDGDSVTGINFNRNDLYLELTFDPVGSWTTLTSPPVGIEVFTRTQLKTAPTAFVAQSLNGFTADNFVQLSPSSIQNKTSATGAIRVNQQGAGNLIQLQSAGSDKLVVNNSGQLQLTGTGFLAGLWQGDSGSIYRNTAGILTDTSSLEIALTTSINGLSNFRGNVRGLVTISNGSTTTTGDASSKTLSVTSTTNFDVGNIILLNGTTYARIDSVDSTTQLAVTPSLTWTAGQTVVEFTVPFTGGDGTAGSPNQQFDSVFVTRDIKTGGDSTTNEWKSLNGLVISRIRFNNETQID